MTKKKVKKERSGFRMAGSGGPDFFDKVELFLQARSRKLYFILLGLSCLTGLILFDLKVSLGGDDSTYIERAYNFLKDGVFPFEQGPLYPLTLSLFVKIFSINLFVLKILSFIFLNIAFYFTYKTLVNRIPYLMLFILLGFLSINAFYQYFASVTYTEAFFIMIQSIVLYYSIRIIDLSNERRLSIRTDWKLIGFTAFLLLLLTLAKTVAIICVVPLLGYYLLNRKWDYLIGFFVAFVGLKIIYEVLIRSMYGAPEMGQFQSMLLKDLYKPQFGYEDFDGMITRFVSNANTFLSTRFLSILYLRSFDENYIYFRPPFTVIIFIGFVASSVLAFFRNKTLFFLSLYTLSLIIAVFFGIQARNTQYRLVIIIVPYLLLALMYGLYAVAKNAKALQVLFFGLASYVLLACVYNTLQKSAKNYPNLVENIKGNRYAGFAQDWGNYLKISEWAAKNIPEGEGILARKASMSFIYGNGRTFTPIYQVPTTRNADSMLLFLKEYHCKYVILAQLRANPKVKDPKNIINTLNIIVHTIADKYPNKFKLLHSEGTDEVGEVFEMDL